MHRGQAKEEKGEEEEGDEEAEEKQEATPAGPMLMFLGGQDLDAQGALKRKSAENRRRRFPWNDRP